MTSIDTIVVPQGAEYKAVCRGLKKANCDRIKVISMPIGTKNIAQTLANYSEELNKARNILIMGLCGSLSEQYSVGDIVLYEISNNTQNQQINLKSDLTAIIQKKLSINLAIGITSDHIICQTKEKIELGRDHSASVVDMEGYDYIKQLQQRNINVAMMRVVSDDLVGDIPDLSMAISADGNLQTIPMAIAFLQQPVAAIRLVKGSLSGLRTLQQTTQKLFGN